MKIRHVEAELFHASRHDQGNGGSSQFCERTDKRIASSVLHPPPTFLV
jgi:hypothetical protein